jgi:replicative superfamily II helicase
MMPIQPDPAGENEPAMQVNTLADLRDRGHISPQYLKAWTQRWSSEQGASNHIEDPASRISLLPLQQEVFSKNETFHWPGKNLLITGPTSGGKTFIAEALIASVISQYHFQSQKCIYAVPLRALVDEKYETFRKIFGSTITAASSADHREHDEQILRGEKRIIVVVYEKLYLWLARPKRYSNLLENTALLVVDELHLVGSPERGAKLEMILTWTRDYQERNPAPDDASRSNLRIVGISSDELAIGGMKPWLDAISIHCDPKKRPLPLIEGIVTLDKTTYVPAVDQADEAKADQVKRDLQEICNKIASLKQQLHARVDDIRTTRVWDNFISVCVNHYLQQGKKVLVYRASKGAAERIALLLEEQLPPREKNWHAVERELKDLEDTHARGQLAKTMRKGVGFHHGDMTPDERNLVESHFRNEEPLDFSLDVIIATPTLSMGINLPADVVVMADPTTFHALDPESRKVKSERLSVMEYKNFAGRAGRFRWDRPDSYGVCILLGTSEDEAKHRLKSLIEDPPTPIRSTLMKPVSGIEPYVLATVGWLEGSGNRRVEADQITGMFNRTYAATLKYAVGRLVTEKFGALTALGYPSGQTPISLIYNRFNIPILGLTGCASVAAGAAISMRTYELLIKLQEELEELLTTPLALFYELATTDEASRLYPSSTDWSRRDPTIETIRDLREHYAELRAKGIVIGEAARRFLDDVQGSTDNYTLEYLIRAAAVWSWMDGKSAPDLGKKKAFPGVRWGHLSELGENFSALVETLARMWYEVSGTGQDVTYADRRRVFNRMKLLSLQLRHGVPAGVEEVANLKVKGWHRQNLLRLWEKQPWEHPVDILELKPDRLPKDVEYLKDKLPNLQQMIEKHPTRWYQNPGAVRQRQEIAARYLLAHQLIDDPHWLDWICEAYHKKDKELEPILVGMLRANPFNFDCVLFDQPGKTGKSHVDLVLRLPEDQDQCIYIEVKTADKSVSWENAAQVLHKIGPVDCEPVNRMTIASPGYGTDVRFQFEQHRGPLLLFTIEAFVQACLVVLREPQHKHKFIDLLKKERGLYETADDVDQELSPQDTPDSYFGA